MNLIKKETTRNHPIRNHLPQHLNKIANNNKEFSVKANQKHPMPPRLTLFDPNISKWTQIRDYFMYKPSHALVAVGFVISMDCINI